MRKIPAPFPHALSFLLLPALLFLTFQEATPCADPLGCLDLSSSTASARVGVLIPLTTPLPFAIEAPTPASTGSLPVSWQVETSSCQKEDLLAATARLLQTPGLVAVLDLGCLPSPAGQASQWILDAGLPLFVPGNQTEADRLGLFALRGLPEFSLSADLPIPTAPSAWVLFYPEEFPFTAWASALCAALPPKSTCQGHPLAEVEEISAQFDSDSVFLFLLEETPDSDTLIEALADYPHPAFTYALTLPTPQTGCLNALASESVTLLQQALPGALYAAPVSHLTLARESLLQNLQTRRKTRSTPVCTWPAASLRPFKTQT